MAMVTTGCRATGHDFLTSISMIKNIVAILVTFSLGILFAFKTNWSGPVKGKVNPEDAALRAWIYGPDTLNAPINSGYFQIDNVKPGTYLLVIEGKPPYRNVSKDAIVVVEGQPSDVGTIEMQK